MDLQEAFDTGFAAVKAYVDGIETSLISRMAAIEAQLRDMPAPLDGKDGEPGPAGPQGDRGEKGEPGADGADGRDGMHGKDGRDGRDGLDVAELVRGEEGHIIATMGNGTTRDLGSFIGPRGEQGERGEPGTDGAQGLRGEKGDTGIAGKDGRDGINGEKGLDGKDGRDGVDGLGFDDVDLVETDEGMVFRMASGENVKQWRLPIPLDRGVFKAGTTYRKGDGVTSGGHYWLALAETKAKPGENGDWRMVVRRGRDGKPGGEPPKDGGNTPFGGK